jgi:hypothetical protein
VKLNSPFLNLNINNSKPIPKLKPEPKPEPILKLIINIKWPRMVLVCEPVWFLYWNS